MEEAYCYKGSLVKSGGGNVHFVVKGCHIYSFSDLESLVNEGFLSRAVPYKTVMDYYGVDKDTVKRHPWGPFSEDSLLRAML